MTNKEAKKVVNILAGADGGCPYCAKELFEDFLVDFPEFKDLTKSEYKRLFKRELSLEYDN